MVLACNLLGKTDVNEVIIRLKAGKNLVKCSGGMELGEVVDNGPFWSLLSGEERLP